MRICPYCAEEIQQQAILCRFCNTDLRTGQVYSAPAGAPVVPPSWEEDPNLRMILPVGRSVWAIAAGYLGLFSLIICPAPLSLIVSAIAIWHLRRHSELLGMGRAVFGLVMGILGTLVLFAMIVSNAGR